MIRRIYKKKQNIPSCRPSKSARNTKTGNKLLMRQLSNRATRYLNGLLSDFFPELSLVVICSSENEVRAHMAAALDQYRLGTTPHCALSKDIRQYLETQFKACPQQQGKLQGKIPAALVDTQR